MSIYEFYKPYFSWSVDDGKEFDTNDPSTHKKQDSEDWTWFDSPPSLGVLSDEESSCGAEEAAYRQDVCAAQHAFDSYNRQVCFGKVHIQEYPVTVGDHPSCRDAYCLTLDWAHTVEQVYDIQHYEDIRQCRRAERGKLARLNYGKRKKRLQEGTSYSAEDVAIGWQLESPSDSSAILDDLRNTESILDEDKFVQSFSFPAGMLKIQILEN
jgi:hypothetical protein